MKFFYLCFFIFCFSSCAVVSRSKRKNLSNVGLKKEYTQNFHLGLRLKMNGQIDEAIKSLYKATFIEEKEDAPHFALAQCFLLKGDLQNASIHTLKAAELDPQNTWYLQELAYMYKELNDPVNGAKTYQKLLKLQPNKAEWLFDYSSLLEASGKYLEAIEILNNAEKAIGINTALSTRKYYLYLKLKNEKQALKELEIAKTKFPKDARLIAIEIDYYFETNQDEKAFKTLEELVEADPTNGNAHKLLGDFYFRTNQNSKGIEQYYLAIKCDLEIDDRMKMAIQLFDVNAPDSIMDELSSYILEVFPENYKAYTFRGDYLQRVKRNIEALEVYLKALEFETSKYLIWQEILLIEYDLQDFNSLYKDVQRCLEYFPNIPNVYLLAGLSSNQLKKYDEAIDFLTSGIDFVMQDNSLLAEFYGQYGEAYFGKKDFRMAKENYSKALKLDPKNVILKNNFAYRLALNKQDLEIASQLIEEVLVDEKNRRFWDTKGFILFQRGDYKAALKIYLEIYDESADKLLIEHLGDAYFKNGDKINAIKFWKKAQELGSTNKMLKQKIEKTDYYEPEY
ncbi:MAG: hypothetical protein RLZ10_1210 [Bacteroidota bacterium]